ncbi:MAG: hypothetical protein CBC48_00875, partial [bacterium TMED88]
MDWNLERRYLHAMGSSQRFDRWLSTVRVRGRCTFRNPSVFGRGRWRLRVSGPSLFVFAIAVLGCGPDPESQRAQDPRPNVLLISVDTIRADH